MKISNIGGQSSNDIAQFLGSLNFPAQKDDLVRQAESSQADTGLLDMIRQLPPGMYNSAADVAERMGLPSGVTDAIKGFGSKH